MLSSRHASAVAVLLVVLLLASDATASEADCNTPACTFTADVIPHDAPAIDGTHQFVIGEFHVAPPNDWKRVHSAPYNGLAISYEDDARLGITRLVAGDLEIDPETFEQADASMRDYYNIVFENTAEDTPPAHGPERRLWQFAMDTKRLQFPEATQAVIIDGEDFRAYSAVINLSRFDTRTIIVHDEAPDTALEILASGLDQETVINVAASAQLR
ncbi:hypothetical protein [Aquisalimonas sp.]|uniref:hypothetical protein n=1 Tax=unclassified Aquisalimonas TaxID=2644645 RepID=UPI0025C43938|nr:hypothetical protein [Aquisalimonas sp.]